MYMSSEDFQALMQRNPSLKIASSSPNLSSKTVDSYDAKRTKLNGCTETEENPRDYVKYLNLRVYVYEDGYVLKKAGNKIPDCSGHGTYVRYDSVREYERELELKTLQKYGEISDLERQVQFILQPGFEINGKKIRPITYTADFCYTDAHGKKIVEDVKALNKKTGKILTTKEFDIKWKILQYQNPELIFKLEAR